MLAVTRSPRVLVKLAGGRVKQLSVREHRARRQFERLYKSIRPRASGLAAAAEPEWHIMTQGSSGAEVNSWDLCHHLGKHGFGIAGVAERPSLPNRISSSNGPSVHRWNTL